MPAELILDLDQLVLVGATGGWLRALLNHAREALRPTRDHVMHRGSVLPPRALRVGGVEYEDDEYFLTSSIFEAGRVIDKLQLDPGGLLVDIGCGQGRLPIGLIRRVNGVSYLGIDVCAKSIEWCRRQIQGRHPSYRFEHIDLVNARYNPAGRPLVDGYVLPVPDEAADIVYMWGLLTNMEPDHLSTYAHESSRMLRRGGRLFLTAHVEDSVPAVSINPSGYTPYSCSGPLHCVRYERSHFMGVFRTAGLTLSDFVYHGARNCQSDLYFVKE